MTLKKTLWQAGLIVLIGTAIGLALNFSMLDKYGDGAFLREELDSEEYPGILYISLVEAEDLFNTRSALFIDSRQTDFYRTGHIFGALNLPYGGEETESLLLELDRTPEETLVVYCDGEECRSSVHLARRLHEIGFLDVRIFFGGWKEWIGAGLPVEGDYVP